MFKKVFFVFAFFGLTFCLGPQARADFTGASKNLSNSALASKCPKVVQIPGTETIFAIWVETDGDNDVLMLSRSTDSGLTWTTRAPVVSGGQILNRVEPIDEIANKYTFSFVVDGPYIHIVFQARDSALDDYEIYYVRLSDLGDSINFLRALTSNSTDSRFPDVAVNGEYVHVTYQDSWPGNEEVFYKRVTNYGAGTMDLTRRLTFSSTDTWAPRIAISSSGYDVNIVYQDENALGAQNIFTKHIENYGAGSYQTYQLTFGSDPDYNGIADIAAGAGDYAQYVYIVYQATWPGNKEIMYKRLSNYGVGPFTVYTARLSYSTADSLAPSIDFDTFYGNVHVSYHDSWPGNNDVMYKSFEYGGGAGFLTKRVSWGTGDSVYPSVAASGSWADIVWSDNSSGNYEVLFKRGY
jgi:hypothetical protein